MARVCAGDGQTPATIFLAASSSQKSAIGNVMPITKTHFGIWTRSAALRRDFIVASLVDAAAPLPAASDC